MIRPATAHDIPEIARLGEKFHAQAGWSDIMDYSVSDCVKSLEMFMASEAFICLVACNNISQHELTDFQQINSRNKVSRIVGMASGVVSPVYFNHAHKSGEELFWWVDDAAPQMTGIRLLDALEREAKARGCSSWQMKSLALLNGDRMGKLYERRGYRASEQSFIKRL